ncbi:MAG TPA: glycosyl hydrolase [Actinomycetes bacterium]
MRVQVVLVAAASLLLLVLGGSAAIDRGDRGAPRREAPDLGVYRGASNLAGVAGFERWLGRGVGVRLDFLPGGSWSEIENPAWQLRRWSQAGGTLVLTVPLLPARGDRGGGGASLRACSTGAYDAHWSRLARNLVEHRLGGSVLRLGHEFNGGWYAWRAAGAEGDFAGCFRQVVRTMRAVPGSGFEFVWNPALGRLRADPPRAYPGDAYVDTVGVDVYDQSWAAGTYPIPADASADEVRERRQRAWAEMLHGELGLEFWSGFARAHGKPLAIPEWGLTRRSDGHGGGDNPYFVEQVDRFVRDPANRVAWFIYFEYDARDGEHQLTAGHFDSAASSFRTHFGAVR